MKTSAHTAPRTDNDGVGPYLLIAWVIGAPLITKLLVLNGTIQELPEWAYWIIALTPWIACALGGLFMLLLVLIIPIAIIAIIINLIQALI